LGTYHSWWWHGDQSAHLLFVQLCFSPRVSRSGREEEEEEMKKGLELLATADERSEREWSAWNRLHER